MTNEQLAEQMERDAEIISNADAIAYMKWEREQMHLARIAERERGEMWRKWFADGNTSAPESPIGHW